MQKNNCKLKTIFKKGLSFSIALALGAAATSLNLAKTAEAAQIADNGSRKVYLVGEKFEVAKLNNKTADFYKSNLDSNYVAGVPVMKEGMTNINFANAADGTDAIGAALNVTVYDWAKIYTGTSVKAENKAAHDAARDAIVDALTLKIPAAKNADVTAISTLLKTGELQTTDGTKIDNVDYAKHNGKDVQIKLPAANNNLVCKLGALEVTRAITGVELLSGPTENCYLKGEEINLAGLSLKVTYDAGEPANVAWTEDTAGEFTFSNSVEQDKEMTDTIKGITVTYGGRTTSETFTLYVVSTVSSVDNGIAKIQGTFEKTPTVSAVSLSEDGDDYKTLKADFSNKDAQVIFAYDVKANYEASVGKMRVALKVGKNYAGQVVTVKHLANDEIETWVDKVDEDGNVTVEVYSLSPFMVVLGATEEDKAAAAETEQKNAEEATKTEAAKTEAAKTEAASKSASKSAKTGDASIVAFSVFGFVALISAAVLAFMKKNRKNFEK